MLSAIWMFCAFLAQEADFPDVGWPRTYEQGGARVVMHQPQLDAWLEYAHLDGRSALAVTLEEGQDPIVGAIHFGVDTVTDTAQRQVLMRNFKISNLTFPGAAEDQVAACTAAVEQALPFGQGFQVSLDRVIAAVDASQAQRKEVTVNLEPPPIFYSEVPAVLVVFLGEPTLEPVEGTGLLCATNTNWDLFLHLGSSRFYLRNGESWLTTRDLEQGPWTASKPLPVDFARLPNDENWAEVKSNLPGKPAATVPRVLVSKTPAELILSDGALSLSRIPGTGLWYVVNTDSDLFLHAEEGNYYYLTAGRWFRARSLEGPWASAMADLPEDFAQIPLDHEMATVLSSVPGTDEAAAAVVLASVPQKATVNKSDLRNDVVYEGDPQFVLIEGTTVYYAVNTSSDVFRVEDLYYCCTNGIWFISRNANGPWEVAEEVPAAIYTIPPDCPKHHVTYVYVYESTPTTVVVGYTSGYYGCYIADGVVVFGGGYYYGPYYSYGYYHYHCHADYYSYGCGVHYDYHSGTWYRSAHGTGPYGGAGRVAAYDPKTGAWARGVYKYGPSGSVQAREAYNPKTGNYAAGVSGKTPYQSWGRGVVSDGDNWVRGGYRSDSRGTVGGIETSEGGVLVGGRRADGSSGAIGRDKDGDLYVGKDGNVYRKQGEQWQKKSPDGWSDVGSGRDERTERREAGGLGARERERLNSGSGSNLGSSRGGLTERLDRDRAGRLNGSRRAKGGLAGRGASRRRGGRGR